jgi:hypothetical protein
VRAECQLSEIFLNSNRCHLRDCGYG